MSGYFRADVTHQDPSYRYCHWESRGSIYLFDRQCQIVQHAERQALADLNRQHALQCPVETETKELRNARRSMVENTNVVTMGRTMGTKLQLAVSADAEGADRVTHDEAVNEFMFEVTLGLLHSRDFV